MTRHFISLIESGRASPSVKTLRILAEKLGKPVGYFLGTEDAADDAELAGPMLQAARDNLTRNEPAVALRLLRRLLQSLADETILAEARMLLVKALRRLGHHEEALSECEQVLEQYQTLRSRDELVQAYMELGACAFVLEDFPKARSAYEKAVTLSSGLKNLTEFHTKSLTYLGTSLLRLGSIDKAIHTYQRALREAESMEDLNLRGSISMGLGKALVEQSDIEEGLRYTTQALALLEEAQSPDKVLAFHNLAVIQMARGEDEEAYQTYHTCLTIYEHQGRPDKQASIYEELAWYWIKCGDVQNAKACCKEALQLLDRKSDGELMGRVYRALGAIAEMSQDHEQAYFYLRISYEWLQRIRATKEAERSYELLSRLRA